MLGKFMAIILIIALICLAVGLAPLLLQIAGALICVYLVVVVWSLAFRK